MRLVFAGTPAPALPTLRALAASRHEVAAVVTRPDAPVGRGKRMHQSPVAELAAELGFETLKPARPNEGWFLDRLRAIAPDCCPVTAYGALLPQSALDIPPHGWVNLHFSVLPAWRGAAPVQHAVLRGDDITGATTFLIVKELDAGPVFGTLTEPIRPTDTSGDLLERLAVSGAELLVRTLDAIEDGTVRAVPQPTHGVSFAPKLTPDDARVDWRLPAHLIDRQLRGCTPDPGAWTEFEAGRLKLWPVTLAAGAGLAAGGPGLAPGELLVDRNAVYAGTGTVPVRLGDVQPQGKRRMPAADWARGRISSGGMTPPRTPPSMEGLRPPIAPPREDGAKPPPPPALWLRLKISGYG
ncbi:MAG: methionyl-tRNA formyltransferase [Actinomycetia bacterium]|nr:methionyl-tRNA formyltransferase [Actinomycetes bacterium]